MEEWSLYEEILAITHRWPVILAFCLVGGLLGWGASLLWPSPYRATTELYVGLNTYRALQDRNAVAFANGFVFTNPDDYKNWQMADLNTVVLMDRVVKDTLNRLRERDSYWQNVPVSELYDMLHVYWRNAGKWRLVAENRDPKRAAQAASAWQEAVIERVDSAVSNAQETLMLDIQIQSLSAAETQPSQRAAQLKQIQTNLEDWQKQAKQWPQDQAVDPAEQWQVRSWAVQAAEYDPVWKELLEAMPPAGALPKDYYAWLEQARASLNSELDSLQVQIRELQRQRQSASEQYQTASKKSLGLSPNLEVEKVSDRPPELSANRPTGLLILVGAVIGLMAWIILWLARISLRKRS